MSPRHARPWPALAAELRAVMRVLRFDPDPSVEVDPRAERVAAAVIAFLVLLGAVGTYLAIAGGLSPLFAATPRDGGPGGGQAPVVQPSRAPTATPAAAARKPNRATSSTPPRSARVATATPSKPAGRASTTDTHRTVVTPTSAAPTGPTATPSPPASSSPSPSAAPTS